MTQRNGPRVPSPRITAGDLWRHEYAPYRVVAERMGCSQSQVAKVAGRLGFRRTIKGEWTHGPCLGCGQVLSVEDMDVGRRCGACTTPTEMPPGVDLEWEREQSKRRMERKRAEEYRRLRFPVEGEEL